MLASIIQRIRATLDRFIRAHIVADEKDLWPHLSESELHEIETRRHA